MPYITAEEVKAIRNNLKKTLPEYKFSVTKDHHSSVNVCIMAGPMKMESGHFMINPYWYEQHYEGNKKMIKLISTILKCISDIKKTEIVVEDSDYGSVPNFYMDINVGKWNKPYVQVK